MLKPIQLKIKAYAIVLKYALNSLAATAMDFTTYHFLVDRFGVEVVVSTFLGNAMGAVISYSMLRLWVFKEASGQQTSQQIGKFIAGVVMITITNMIFVSMLHYFFAWSAWPARIASAIGAWLLGYWFNRKIVFTRS